MHLLDLLEFGLKVLNGLVCAQIVDDPAQRLQAVDIDADPTHLARLGTEAVTDIGRGDDLCHCHRSLVPVQADGGGRSGHRRLDAVGACACREHEAPEMQHHIGLLHEPVGVKVLLVVARMGGR